MGEEEPSAGIIRVSVSIGMLVVDTMITAPPVDGALVGDGVEEHEEDAEWQVGLVRPVSPQTMGPSRDPH